MPAHLCGAGSPARVLITRPTSPGGGQVPGTPKNRVVYGVSVHPPGGPSLALEFLALLVTSRYVPPLVLKARPLRNSAGFPTERPPSKDSRYSTPRVKTRLTTSQAGTAPRPRQRHPSITDVIPTNERAQRKVMHDIVCGRTIGGDRRHVQNVGMCVS